MLVNGHDRTYLLAAPEDEPSEMMLYHETASTLAGWAVHPWAAETLYRVPRESDF